MAKTDSKQAKQAKLPPTVEKHQKATLPPPLISCGKLERHILGLLIAQTGEGRVNIHKLAKDREIARSTVYNAVKRLLQKGLICQPNYYSHAITDAGRAWLLAEGPNRTVCRARADSLEVIRDHKFTFKLPVFRWPANWEGNRCDIIDKKSIQTKLLHFSKNNPQVFAEFPDNVRVTFTSRHIIIKPQNIFEQDHALAAELAISRTLEVMRLLTELGFRLDDAQGKVHLLQIEGHYTLVNSVLGQWFEKNAPGFCIRDKDNKAIYWVDHSTGKLEDETSTETGRDRLDTFLRDIMEKETLTPSELSESLMRCEKLIVDLVKLEAMRHYSPLKSLPGSLEPLRYVG